MYKKFLLTLVCLAVMVCGANVGFAKDAAAVKRCPCKKIFEQTLNLSPEQVKLADINRKEEGQNLKPINAKIRANNKKRLENRYYAKTMRNSLKTIRLTEDKNEASKKLPQVTSLIDKLAKKGIIHKNKAANLKSGLMKKINKM